MNHKDKLKLARKKMTPGEIRAHVSPFQSAAWEARKQANQRRVEKKIAATKERKRLKLETLKKKGGADHDRKS